jgi:hypothetical protein
LNHDTKIAFLRAKADLIIGYARDEQARVMLNTLFAWIDGYKTHPSLKADDYRRADQLLEGTVETFAPEIRKRIADQLTGQFGFARLGGAAKPRRRDLIEEVLQSGRIRTDDDARLVGEFLANTTNIEVIGADRYQRLGAILDSYQGEVARTPPNPE